MERLDASEAIQHELRNDLDAAQVEIQRILEAGIRGRAAEATNLFEQPSLLTAAVALLAADTELEILGWQDGWFRVAAGDAEGWVPSDQVDLGTR